jgi:hypothetical protein
VSWAAAAWAAGPDGLAGEGDELTEVLDKVPTGRLVVLGEPGAGKTILMVRLVLDLLARRAAGVPVPVLAPVASWDPSGQDLRDWLIARLMTDYPALAGPPPPAAAESTRAAALLEAGLILPILDGLDEIPDRARGPAISRINDALRPGEQVVVTCRTEQYRDAVRPLGGPEVTLRAAAAIQLRPLYADAVRRYLSADAPGPVARARWDPVLAELGTQAPVGQALSTPLMVGLARAIYNPRPGEQAGTTPDPAELCGFADHAAVEAHLFDEFIPAAYRAFAEGRWTAGQAGAWLTFLACHLEQTVGSPDLAWWQLQKAVPRTTLRLAAGLAAGLVFGLVAGVVFGLASGVVFGLASGPELPARGMRINAARLVVGLVLGLVFGLVVGLASGLVVGLVVGLVFGLLTTVWWTIEGVSPNLAETINPRTVLRHDRQTTFFVALGAGLALGLAVGLASGLASGLAAGLASGLAAGLAVGLAGGLGVGLVFGLTGSLSETNWASYMLAVTQLAMRHRLPWSLMDFLADAHQRGVLRQAGAVYQFRHIDLQHRLAATRPDWASPAGQTLTIHTPEN